MAAQLGVCTEEVWMLMDPEGGITVHETESRGLDGIAQLLKLEANKPGE